jgi:hypothetical protein
MFLSSAYYPRHQNTTLSQQTTPPQLLLQYTTPRHQSTTLSKQTTTPPQLLLQYTTPRPQKYYAEPTYCTNTTAAPVYYTEIPTYYTKFLFFSCFLSIWCCNFHIVCSSIIKYFLKKKKMFLSWLFESYSSCFSWLLLSLNTHQPRKHSI